MSQTGCFDCVFTLVHTSASDSAFFWELIAHRWVQHLLQSCCKVHRNTCTSLCHFVAKTPWGKPPDLCQKHHPGADFREGLPGSRHLSKTRLETLAFLCSFFGVPNLSLAWLFQTWLFDFFCAETFFCAFLRSSAYLRLRSFASDRV